MKKEDHLKIVRELEIKIADLEKRILEVHAVNAKLHGQLDLKDFNIQHKNQELNAVVARNTDAANFIVKYDKSMKEFYKSSNEQMKISYIKFNELKDYIIKSFPSLVLTAVDDDIKKDKDENLSDTFINEHGIIYKPRHIVDVAIVILDMQRKKLREILGDEDLNTDRE